MDSPDSPVIGGSGHCPLVRAREGESSPLGPNSPAASVTTVYTRGDIPHEVFLTPAEVPPFHLDSVRPIQISLVDARPLHYGAINLADDNHLYGPRMAKGGSNRMIRVSKIAALLDVHLETLYRHWRAWRIKA